MNDIERIGPEVLKPAPGSLLQAHLGLLHGEKSLHLEEEREIAALQDMAWPELNLKRSSRWMTAPLFLLAASIAMIVVRLPEPQSGLTIKGTTKIFAVLEKEGKSTLMSKGQRLETGDRMNIEIIAGEALKAFMGVFNRQGVLLSATSDILANSLDIAAGKRGYFQTALELTKENDGEQVLIVTCQSEAWSKHFKIPETFTKVYFNSLPSLERATDKTSICESDVIKLRD